MFSHAESELFYNVANAPIRGFPYPHIYVPEVFPADFYGALQQNLPDPEVMIPIEQARAVRGYKERYVLGFSEKDMATLPEDKRQFWQDFMGWLLAGRFLELLLTKFRPFVEQRFAGIQGVYFYNESLLV